MKQGEGKEPPKKKLKQAQLSFFTSPKPGTKRKIGVDSTSDDDVQFVKVLCKSPDEKSVDLEKENVCSNKTDSCEKKKASAPKIVLQSSGTLPDNSVEAVDLTGDESKSSCDTTTDNNLTKNGMPVVVLKRIKLLSHDNNKEEEEINDSSDDYSDEKNCAKSCKPTGTKPDGASSRLRNIVSSNSVSAPIEGSALTQIADENCKLESDVSCECDDSLAVPLKAEFKSDDSENTSHSKGLSKVVIKSSLDSFNSEPLSKQSNITNVSAKDVPTCGKTISLDEDEGVASLKTLRDNNTVEALSNSDKMEVSSVENTPVSVRRSSVSSSDDLSPSEESSATPSSLISPKTPGRKLTPKQLLQREETLKRREDREKLRQEKKADKFKRRQEIKMEKDKQRKELKEEKEKKRLAELESKNEEKRLKEEKKRVKREKEEKEKKKKEEEKRKKREEKQKEEEAKEEEKRKKKEEKRREEEAKEEMKMLEKKKEEQAKAAFASFFKKPRKSEPESSPQEGPPKQNKFMPFPVKQDMMLSVVNRRVLTDSEKTHFDAAVFEKGAVKQLYLDQLRSKEHTPLKSDPTWPISAFEEQHDVIIIESIGENSMDVDQQGGWTDKPTGKSHKYRAKLLQFYENRRPAYWGTWRKKPVHVSARRPFTKEQGVLDYEVDSDSEWEDEEEGESLEDDEKEQRSDEEETGGENGYILDTQFVPHGYLSDEEANSQEDTLSPEAQKLRLTVLKEEFDEEMKQKAERLKPRLLGCVWVSNSIDLASVNGGVYEALVKHRVVWDESKGMIDVSEELLSEQKSVSLPVSASKNKKLSPPMVEALVRLVHGSHGSMPRLLNEFLGLVEKDFPASTVTKRAVCNKMKEIATKTHDSNGKPIWSVNNDLWETYGLSSVTDVAPVPPPNLPLEKPKKTLIDSFLNGSTPPTAEKRVQLMSTRVELNEKKEEKAKKRCTLITLPRTPANSGRPAVHQDTPRPLVNKFLDLTRDDHPQPDPAVPQPLPVIDLSEDTN